MQIILVQIYTYWWGGTSISTDFWHSAHLAIITQFAWDACTCLTQMHICFFYKYTKKIHILPFWYCSLFSLLFSFCLPDKMHIWQRCIFAQYRRRCIIAYLAKMKKCKNANLAHLAKMKNCTLWQLLWHDEAAASDLSAGFVVFRRTKIFTSFFGRILAHKHFHHFHALHLTSGSPLSEDESFHFVWQKNLQRILLKAARNSLEIRCLNMIKWFTLWWLPFWDI